MQKNAVPNPEYWWSIGYCYAKIGALLNVKCGDWLSIGYCNAKIGAPLNVKCGDWLSIGFCPKQNCRSYFLCHGLL